MKTIHSVIIGIAIIISAVVHGKIVSNTDQSYPHASDPISSVGICTVCPMSEKIRLNLLSRRSILPQKPQLLLSQIDIKNDIL